MKVTSCVIIAIFILSGCSFSKDNSNSVGVDLVQKKIEKVDTTATKPEGHFQIYHQLELEEANAKISGKSDLEIKALNSDKDFRAYEDSIQAISELVLANKEGDAVLKVSSLNVACNDVELSLIHNFIKNNGSEFSSLQRFLQKRSCGAVANDDLYKVFVLESRRAFNNKFSDPTLLAYIIHHPNFVSSPLVPIGNTGVSINLIALNRVWLSCKYMDVDESIVSGKANDIQNEFVCDPPDITEDQVAIEAKLKKNLGISNDAVEVRYIKDGKLIIQSGYLPMTLTYNHGISSSLVSYFKTGDLNEADEDFGEGVLRELRMEYNQ